MSPLERKVQELEKKVAQMERAENVAFIEALARRLTDAFNIPERLSDLSDVGSDTDSPSTGQVLKYDGTDWSPGTDNTA